MLCTRTPRPTATLIENKRGGAWHRPCPMEDMRQEDSIRLQDFIDASKGRGASDQFLEGLLTRRGWPAADIYNALGRHWERSTGLAIPERAGAAESARDAFLYLLSFSTLAGWTTAVGSMIFEFINHWFPDPVSRSYVY